MGCRLKIAPTFSADPTLDANREVPHSAILLSDRGAQQIPVPHIETYYLPGKLVGKGLHTEEEQMVRIDAAVLSDETTVLPSRIRHVVL